MWTVEAWKKVGMDGMQPVWVEDRVLATFDNEDDAMKYYKGVAWQWIDDATVWHRVFRKED